MAFLIKIADEGFDPPLSKQSLVCYLSTNLHFTSLFAIFPIYNSFINKLMMSHSSTLRMSENSSLSLYNIHTSLLKMWTENQVDELYQRVFLTYLDSLSEPEGKKEIMREYQRMLDNRSHYNKIRELNNFREETL